MSTGLAKIVGDARYILGLDIILTPEKWCAFLEMIRLDHLQGLMLARICCSEDVQTGFFVLVDTRNRLLWLRWHPGKLVCWSNIGIRYLIYRLPSSSSKKHLASVMICG